MCVHECMLYTIYVFVLVSLYPFFTHGGTEASIWLLFVIKLGKKKLLTLWFYIYCTLRAKIDPLELMMNFESCSQEEVKNVRSKDEHLKSLQHFLL